MDKIRLSSALFSSIALFISASFFISFISGCVLASRSLASSLLLLRSFSSWDRRAHVPCTAALASCFRSSLSFDADDLEDDTGLMPTLLRKIFELFLESTWDTTYTLDTSVSSSPTGFALKASILTWNTNYPSLVVNCCMNLRRKYHTTCILKNIIISKICARER
jgi:hypothetical protein